MNCQNTSSLCNVDGCKRKLGLMPFKCRCEGEYCAKHRMPESHSCIFDYKASGRELLAKSNQVVTHEKVIHI